MRKGANLTQMTEKYGMNNKDVIKHLGRNLYKENGKWKVTKSDSLQVGMRFYDQNAGHITIVTRGSKERSLIGEYFNAVNKTLKEGDTTRLKKFAGVKIVDNAGNEHSFEMREGGSWLIDGDTPIEKVKETLSIDSFPEEEDGYYYTISGLIMFILNRMPNIGNQIEVKGIKYEVVSMDGNRINKVLATRIKSVTDDATI
jgi:hypothetical protein